MNSLLCYAEASQDACHGQKSLETMLVSLSKDPGFSYQAEEMLDEKLNLNLT